MTPQQILYTASPLKTLELPLLQEIWSEAKEVEMGRDEFVFTEGDASDGSLYMVVDGELAVLFTRADGSQESKPKLRGELCGESALVNRDGTRTATVQVVSDRATLLCWDGNALLDKPTLEPLAKLLGSIAWVNTRETEDLKRF
jgi:CRP-like cAMP-binding protein